MQLPGARIKLFTAVSHICSSTFQDRLLRIKSEEFPFRTLKHELEHFDGIVFSKALCLSDFKAEKRPQESGKAFCTSVFAALKCRDLTFSKLIIMPKDLLQQETEHDLHPASPQCPKSGWLLCSAVLKGNLVFCSVLTAVYLDSDD